MENRAESECSSLFDDLRNREGDRTVKWINKDPLPPLFFSGRLRRTCRLVKCVTEAEQVENSQCCSLASLHCRGMNLPAELPNNFRGSLQFCLSSLAIFFLPHWSWPLSVLSCSVVHDAKSADGKRNASCVQEKGSYGPLCFLPHVLQFLRICPWRRGMSCPTSDAGRESCSMILRCVTGLVMFRVFTVC